MPDSELHELQALNEQVASRLQALGLPTMTHHGRDFARSGPACREISQWLELSFLHQILRPYFRGHLRMSTAEERLAAWLDAPDRPVDFCRAFLAAPLA